MHTGTLEVLRGGLTTELAWACDAGDQGSKGKTPRVWKARMQVSFTASSREVSCPAHVLELPYARFLEVQRGRGLFLGSMMLMQGGHLTWLHWGCRWTTSRFLAQVMSWPGACPHYRGRADALCTICCLQWCQEKSFWLNQQMLMAASLTAARTGS